MDQREFQREKKCLDRIIEQCKFTDDELLLHYCNCVMKMHRAYYKLQNSHMISYVRQIMTPAFQLLIKYFSDRAAEYFNTESDKDRMKIFADIEYSVVNFSEAFEIIIRSTNGADRMLVQSVSVDTGIHNASSKLCAYYSEILNCLAKIFRTTSVDEYAFCVYPTIEISAEAILLFSTMHRRGKIGIIKIPGKDIADVPYIQTMLLHEFYHVIPSELRLRRKRASFLLRIMMYDVKTCILEGVVLPEGFNDLKLEQFLLEDIYNDFRKALGAKTDGDRAFYSENVKGSLCDSFFRKLQTIHAIETSDLYELVYGSRPASGYEQYSDRMNLMMDCRFKIIDNSYRLLARSELQKKVECYMTIFREVFADLLSVITLRLQPDDFLDAFRYISAYGQDEGDRTTLYFRIYLVIKCMTEPIKPFLESQEKLFSNWKKWKENMEVQESTEKLIKKVALFEKKLQDNAQDMPNISCDCDKDSGKIAILPNKAIVRHYLNYFVECRNGFLMFEYQKQDAFANFRDKFHIDNGYSYDEIWTMISTRSWEKIRFSTD